jgi:PAS domain-containing protein
MAQAQPVRTLRTAPRVPSPRAVFCSHCGKPPADGRIPEVGSRVCVRCNLGLLLDAPAASVPKANEAFLVVDRSLSVCGLSRRAEKLLGVREVEVVDRHVTDLLVPADTESDPTRPHALSALLVAATAGDEELVTIVLRPVDEFGVRFSARIGPCGPAPGALVVLDLG